jgi:hypothetical protein
MVHTFFEKQRKNETESLLLHMNFLTQSKNCQLSIFNGENSPGKNVFVRVASSGILKGQKIRKTKHLLQKKEKSFKREKSKLFL